MMFFYKIDKDRTVYRFRSKRILIKQVSVSTSGQTYAASKKERVNLNQHH